MEGHKEEGEGEDEHHFPDTGEQVDLGPGLAHPEFKVDQGLPPHPQSGGPVHVVHPPREGHEQQRQGDAPDQGVVEVFHELEKYKL